MTIRIGQLLNSKRDLPKVSVFCITCLGVAATFQLLGWTFPPYAATACVALAAYVFYWHLKRAHLDEDNWTGFVCVLGLTLLVFLPLGAGLLFGGTEPGVGMVVGLIWTAILLLTIQAGLWMLAYSELGPGVDFLRDVGLAHAEIAGNEPLAHQLRTQKRTAALITDKTAYLRVLAISAKDDLVTDSPILDRLRELKADRKGPWRTPAGIRVLLLDPFSTFATARARHLAMVNPGISAEDAELTYVTDFLAATEQLDALGIQYRIYCSRPLFRFYLGIEANEAHQWCIAQTYLDHKHGYETPTLEYRRKDGGSRPEDCFMTLAGQAFEYMWVRAFRGYTEQHLGDSAIVFYMAKMYDLPLAHTVTGSAGFADLRRAVVEHAERCFQRARGG